MLAQLLKHCWRQFGGAVAAAFAINERSTIRSESLSLTVSATTSLARRPAP